MDFYKSEADFFFFIKRNFQNKIFNLLQNKKFRNISFKIFCMKNKYLIEPVSLV